MASSKNKKPTPAKSAKKVLPATKKVVAAKSKVTAPAKKAAKSKTITPPKALSKSKVAAKPSVQKSKPAAKSSNSKTTITQKPITKSAPVVKKKETTKASSTTKNVKSLNKETTSKPIPPKAIKQEKIKPSKIQTAAQKSKNERRNAGAEQPLVATVKAKISPTLENKKKVTKTNSNPVVSPATNGKTRYSDQELAEFKVIIDEKLSAARQELNYLQEQIVEMNENNSDIQGSDWFDDSSIHSEVELLNNMAIRQRQFIQNLENALVRIENKTYGICIITGNLIDKKRLLLVPHATKSIEAKHIEQATMVPDINQVAPDERVLRRTAEGKTTTTTKKGVKKTKGKASRDFEDEDGDDAIEAPIEELDMRFEGGDD